MFLLLSRILLWLLIGTIVYSLFQRVYPTGNFAGRFLLILLLLIVVLSFVNPDEPAVAALWEFVSFPLKPLGASILLLFFGAQKIVKGGGIDKPGGYYLGWALGILILSSTPVVAYFLGNPPVPAAGLPPETLVALNPVTTDVAGNNILPNFDSLDMKAPPILLQNPQEIRTRGLRIEYFVPNAQTLQQTTLIWESYLREISIFLRGRRT
jgi:hypothetical protein